MIPLHQLIEFLREFAPPDLAESWDNVGLLIGDPASEVTSVLTCLTLTPNVAEEAIAREAQLIVTHHPVLFRPVKQLTTATSEGRMLLSLIRAGIAVYSPHTSYDSAADGINQQLARSFGLQEIQPLRPNVEMRSTTSRQISRNALASGSALTSTSEPDASAFRLIESKQDVDSELIPIEQPVGSGRFGRLPRPMSMSELIQQTKTVLGISQLQYVGSLDRTVTKLAIACGAAAEFLADAARCGSEAFLTGEARFHSCLEAEAANVAMILPGHYATERPAMLQLATILKSRFPELVAQASESENDPVKFG